MIFNELNPIREQLKRIDYLNKKRVYLIQRFLEENLYLD